MLVERLAIVTRNSTARIWHNIPEIYYGGFANASYAFGTRPSTTPPTPTQIPESGVTITAVLMQMALKFCQDEQSTKDMTAADSAFNKSCNHYTGDHNGVTTDQHMVRNFAWAAGGGEDSSSTSRRNTLQQLFSLLMGADRGPPAAFIFYCNRFLRRY